MIRAIFEIHGSPGSYLYQFRAGDVDGAYGGGQGHPGGKNALSMTIGGRRASTGAWFYVEVAEGAEF